MNLANRIGTATRSLAIKAYENNSLLRLAYRVLVKRERPDDDIEIDDSQTGEINPALVHLEITGLDRFQLFGDEWLVDGSMAPIVVLFGVGKPYRGLVSQFFRGNRVAFGRDRFFSLSAYRAMRSLRRQGLSLYTTRRRLLTATYAQMLRRRCGHISHQIMTLSGEAPSLKYPLAAAVDEQGDFNDPSTSTVLERKLNSARDLTQQEQEATRNLIDDLISMGRSMWSDQERPGDPRALGPKTERWILVTAIENDAAYRFMHNRVSNNDLVQIALDENPDARIFFCPAEKRRSVSKKRHLRARLAKKVTVVEPEISDTDLVSSMDHIYTVSSLLGFDALLRRKTVTCFGVPFYSGWGLTDDRQSLTRRKKVLSIEQLFRTFALEYLTYIPDSDRKAGLLQAQLRAVAQELRIYTPREWPIELSFVEDSIIENTSAILGLASDDEWPKQLESIFARWEMFGPEAKIFTLLGGKISDQVCSQLSEFLIPNTIAGLFPHLASYLIHRVRYDELSVLVRAYAKWFDEVAQLQLESVEIRAFFVDLAYAMRRLNGRTLDRVPEFSSLLTKRYDDFVFLVGPYFRVLTMNVEYLRAEEIVESRPIDNPKVLFSLSSILAERPSRSERDGFRRNRLRRTYAARALTLLDAVNEGWTNQVINKLVYYLTLEEETDVIRTVGQLHDGLHHEAAPAQASPSRMKELLPVVQFLIGRHQLEAAKTLFDDIRTHLSSRSVESVEIQIAALEGRKDEALRRFEQLDHGKVSRPLNKMLWDRGFRRASIDGQDSLPISRAWQTRLADADMLKRLKFLERASEIVTFAPQPALPKGIVLVGSLSCVNTIAMVAPMLNELKKRGYAVLHLSEGMLDNPPVNEATYFAPANQFAGAIPRGDSDGKILLEWIIDWRNRRVEASGINFYQGIYETLSNRFRRFHIDITDPEVARSFNRYLRSMDFILRLCQRIEDTLVDKGVPVVLLAGNSHAAPFSVFRDFCLHMSKPNLRFVASNVAYENYYSNLGSKFSGSMAVVDMTLHRTTRAPFLAVPERFEQWLKKNSDSPIILEKTQQLLSANRNQGMPDPSTTRADVLIKARADGKKIICCFGKILCDLGVPYDGGPAHTDIVDWINHTVESVRGRDDVLLLVKPHPHELRPEIALDLVEYLSDVLPKDLPENVLVLGHREFNVHEIVKFIDLAVLWNGTSALEIASLGFPVMMCSHFARHDYPIPLIYPDNREQYTQYLLAGEYELPDEETRHRAMALLHYMGTDDVALANRYSRRGSTNDKVGSPVWDESAVQNFLKHGDPTMTLAASRVVEGLEREFFS